MRQAECFSATTQRIRAAMLGVSAPDLQIHRQAWRVRDDDSDELLLVCVDSGSWWLAERAADRLTVWAFADDEQASAAFDRHLGRGRDWREAAASRQHVA